MKRVLYDAARRHQLIIFTRHGENWSTSALLPAGWPPVAPGGGGYASHRSPAPAQSRKRTGARLPKAQPPATGRSSGELCGGRCLQRTFSWILLFAKRCSILLGVGSAAYCGSLDDCSTRLNIPADGPLSVRFSFGFPEPCVHLLYLDESGHSHDPDTWTSSSRASVLLERQTHSLDAAIMGPVATRFNPLN